MQLPNSGNRNIYTERQIDLYINSQSVSLEMAMNGLFNAMLSTIYLSSM